MIRSSRRQSRICVLRVVCIGRKSASQKTAVVFEIQSTLVLLIYLIPILQQQRPSIDPAFTMGAPPPTESTLHTCCALHITPCQHCSKNTCLWSIYKHTIIGDSARHFDGVEEVKSVTRHNRAMDCFIREHWGTGVNNNSERNRNDIPFCVRMAILQQWPSPRRRRKLQRAYLVRRPGQSSRGVLHRLSDPNTFFSSFEEAINSTSQDLTESTALAPSPPRGTSNS